MYRKYIRRGVALVLSGAMVLMQAVPAMAYDRLGDAISGWVWEDYNDDGVYECYYRDMEFLQSTDAEFRNAVHFWTESNKNNQIRTTPDGYQVNAALQWIVDGVVQTKTDEAKAEAAKQKMIEDEYNRMVQTYENMKAPEEKKSSMTAPSVSENSELFSMFREVFPGSELDVRMLYRIRYGYTPTNDWKNTSFSSTIGSLLDKPLANVLCLMAGRELPYPDQWGPQCQFLYDWFVDFLSSDDWNNKSEYERAYGAYRYLAKKYAYGEFKEETPIPDDGAEGPSYIAKVLNGEQFVCQQFALAYYLLGISLGLDVGFNQLDISKGNPFHLYNVIRIDGTLYLADASGYSKYGKDSYFGVYEDHFYCGESYENPDFQNPSLTLTPVEEIYSDYPGTTLTNPQGQSETLWKGTRAARQYP